ncbi:hypothetical protein ACFSHQ_05795 [Gemmobacter lanyuensis]
MVQAIDFAVRNSAGAVTHGIAGGEGSNFIQIGSGEQISLNVAQSSVLGYERKGANLIVHLVDGSDVVLNGYYDVAPGQLNRLYLSSNGEVTEVLLSDAGTAGPVAASYGPVDAWNKFSTLDDLRFEGADAFADAQIYSDEPAGMGALAPGLLGAGGLGAAALAAGLLGGVALLGGGSSGEGATAPTIRAVTAPMMVTMTAPTMAPMMAMTTAPTMATTMATTTAPTMAMTTATTMAMTTALTMAMTTALTMATMTAPTMATMTAPIAPNPQSTTLTILKP